MGSGREGEAKESLAIDQKMLFFWELLVGSL
jgi:hypothetical protein